MEWSLSYQVLHHQFLVTKVLSIFINSIARIRRIQFQSLQFTIIPDIRDTEDVVIILS